MGTTARFSLVLAAALSVPSLTGCSSGHRQGAADKAGGSGAPIVLRLAFVGWSSQGDASLLMRFSHRVAKLSGRRLRVQVIDTDYDGPDEEQRVARVVRDGRFDLGWIATGGWDALGVKSFRALQAPFLIGDYSVMDAVARSALAARMLAGPDRYGATGLALVPTRLLHPSAPHALLSPSTYKGVRFLVTRWQATDELLSALGARPVYTVDTGGPGALTPLQDKAPNVVTGNVVLYARFGTLFADRDAIDRLSDSQEHALRNAAKWMVAEAIELTPSEQASARVHCKNGRIALADPGELAALQRAARPVTAELESDPQTNEFITDIRKLKASTPRGPRLVVPPGCGHQNAVRHATPRPPSLLNGTYRYTLTHADADAYGPPATDPGNHYPLVVTWTLRDGSWASGEDTGTYTITGNRLAVYYPKAALTDTVTFRRDADGTLHLRAARTGRYPMDPFDRFQMTTRPWQRIGPPVRNIP